MENEKDISQEEINQETTAEQNEESNNAQKETNELNETETLRKQLEEQNDKFLRLYSEFDNFRKRTAREKLDIVKNAGEDVIKQMLPIIDDFERAIQNNENVEDTTTLKEGFNLIYSKLKTNLEAKGLTPMGAKGEPFDTDKHEALTNIPAPSDEEKGKVVDVIEKGYLLNDKVIRFAKVVVGS
ncbi:MAG: nucleotide exchange factor GrpE [Flavobacteriales bacterium]